MEIANEGDEDDLTKKNIDLKVNKDQKRWQIVDFGLIPIVLKQLLQNISEKTCGTLTILITSAISIGDTVSDFVVFFTLLYYEHYSWALVVVTVDYLPSWDILAHNTTSPKWKKFKNKKEKLFSVIFLMLSPLSMPLFHLRWLINFETADQETFDFLHHNARMSQLLSGSFESPVQIVILLILYGKNMLDRPFEDTSECIIDSAGRALCLGILPGIISFLTSLLSIMKGSLEISEGKNWQDKLNILVYAFANFTFRLPSISLLVLFFDEWSIFIFSSIVLVNVIIIVRYDEVKRKEFSIISSAVISSVSPFVASDQTNLYQRRDLQGQHSSSTTAVHRKRLASRLTISTTTQLLASDLVLLLLLKYRESFNYRDDVEIERDMAINLLMKYLLPIGLITLIVNLLHGIQLVNQKNQVSNWYQIGHVYDQLVGELFCAWRYLLKTLGLVCLFFGTLALSILAISTMYKDRLSNHMHKNSTRLEVEISSGIR